MLQVNEADIDRISEAFYGILKGKTPRPIALPEDYPDNEVKQAVGYINRFIEQHTLFTDLMFSLSRGDLDLQSPPSQLQSLQSLKNLQANLRHLTWKTQQIADGDFTQSIDFMGDFSQAFNSMTQQLKEAFETIERQNAALTEANEVIRAEKEKSDRLLLNILPARVANDLKQTGHTKPELFDSVSVLFSDMVGFTKTSSQLSPEVLIDELNDLFTAFDAIAEENGCERIKTIGDAYLAVCGMPTPDAQHADRIVRTALGMTAYLEERNAAHPQSWQIRVGVHSGPVVGAVVGVKKYIYDVFGDTINTASRMESNSEAMRINVSEATHVLVKDSFRFTERPPVEVKGKGAMRMYFVDGLTRIAHHICR